MKTTTKKVRSRITDAIEALGGFSPATVARGANTTRLTAATALLRDAADTPDGEIALTLLGRAQRRVDALKPAPEDREHRRVVKRALRRAQRAAEQIPCDEVDRVPYWPFFGNMLYAGSGDTPGYGNQTLHLPLLPRKRALQILDLCAERGHTHVFTAGRSGLDGWRSFGLKGDYDFLVRPAEMEWLHEAILEREMGQGIFLLEDDDRGFNSREASFEGGATKFLDYWAPAPGISMVYTGIEVDETVNEGGPPGRNKPKTLAMQTRRMAFLKARYPDLPRGLHLTSDGLIEVPDVDFYGYQAHGENHDEAKSLRKPGAFESEFGPNMDNGRPRPGLLANQRGFRLALMEIADRRLSENAVHALVAGAARGAKAAGNEFASGMGRP